MIRIDEKKASQRKRAERVEELKRLIAATDYKVLPDYDKPAVDILSQRQAWRDEIRALELQ